LFGEGSGVVRSDIGYAIGLHFILGWASFTKGTRCGTRLVLTDVAEICDNDLVKLKGGGSVDVFVYIPIAIGIPFVAELSNSLALGKLIIQSSVDSID
jgi:hypothetical protein